jgi:hypothetical protein
MNKLKDVLERAEAWPLEAQQELAEIALEIEASVTGGAYQATEEELEALDRQNAAVWPVISRCRLRSVLSAVHEGRVFQSLRCRPS